MGPVLGVVLGLIVISAAATCWVLYRRRKLRAVDGSIQDSHQTGYKASILKWLYGMPPPNVTSSHGASELGGNNKDPSETAVAPSVASHGRGMSLSSVAQEVDGLAVYELDCKCEDRTTYLLPYLYIFHQREYSRFLNSLLNIIISPRSAAAPVGERITHPLFVATGVCLQTR